MIAIGAVLSAFFQIASLTSSGAATVGPEAAQLQASLRLRSEDSRFESEDGARYRYRSRIRLRLGGTYELEHGLLAGARVTTGAADDATSSQFTFGESFAKRQLLLDLAYIQWTPTPALAIVGGKIPNPFLRANLLWDKDVNPEGAAARVSVTNGKSAAFATAGGFALQESPEGEADVYVSVGQAGASREGELVQVTVAGGYYHYDNLTRTVLVSRRTGANTRNVDGTLAYDYRVPVLLLRASLAAKIPVSIVLEASRNFSARARESHGLLAEIEVGRAKRRGDWSVSVSGQRLERDSTPDSLSESSWHEQRTNYQGIRSGVRWMAYDHATLALNGRFVEALDGPLDDEARLTFDAVFER